MDEPIDDEQQPVEPEVIALDRLSKAAVESLGIAKAIAARFGDTYVGTEHLLLALAECQSGAACAVLDSLLLTRERLEREFLFIYGHRNGAGNGEPVLAESPRLQHVLAEAAKDAARRQHAAIGTLNLLGALLREGGGLAVILLEAPGVRLERAGLAISQALRDGAADAD
jgi:ATP-dependent Clp protease ATP-binding subunit ClpC